MCNSKLSTDCREVEGLYTVCTHNASSGITPQAQSAEKYVSGKEDGLTYRTLADDLGKQLEALKPASLRLINAKVASSYVEDIWQNSCVEAIKSISTLRDKQKLPAWFKKIVSRQISAFYRGELRYSQIRQLPDSASSSIPYYEPERAFEETQLREDLERVIEKLGYESRKVFRLHYKDGRTTPQIAELLGEKKPTIQSRLIRAQRKVREELLKLGHKPGR